jgi:site-specific recombinase XerD
MGKPSAGDNETKAVKTITLRHDLDACSKFFEWAIKMGYTPANPVRGVTKPSTEDAVRMYILSNPEEFLYFEEAQARSMDLRDVATLIINQGMRPEEVIEIERRTLTSLLGPCGFRAVRQKRPDEPCVSPLIPSRS